MQYDDGAVCLGLHSRHCVGDRTQNLWTATTRASRSTHLLQKTLLLLDGQGEVFLQLGIILLALLLKLLPLVLRVKPERRGQRSEVNPKAARVRNTK